MNTSTFLASFLRQLCFWAIHCTLSSLPSFCIALLMLNLWEKPLAVFAMVCGIVTFILLYAVFTSLVKPLADEKHVISRSLKLGTKIRAWISGLSLLMTFTPAVMLTPDFWCGFFAFSIADSVFTWAGGTGSLFSKLSGNSDFLLIYTITMVEGIILTFLLFMITFFAVIFVQARDRKRLFAGLNPLDRTMGN